MSKKIIILLLFCTTLVTINFSCKKDSDDKQVSDSFFLSEIRVKYFDNLNFQSAEVVNGIAAFRENFYNTFNKLEEQYNAGTLTSRSDLENYRLMGQYYGFYTLALTAAYLDGNVTFDKINGNSSTGLFSKLPASTPDFAQKELEAMITKGVSVAKTAAYIYPFNDKVYGFYLAALQIEKRLKGKTNHNDPDVHKQVMDFSNVALVNYDYIPTWNLLMTMVTLTNYDDTLNTFSNPNMDIVYFSASARLRPRSLPDQGGKYPEILGPLYRFDLCMKKIDHIITTNPVVSNAQVDEIKNNFRVMDTITNFIEVDKAALLNSWPYKNTYTQRKDKLAELKTYVNNLLVGTKPDLKSFINTKDFKRAYQCYSCHRPSGL